MGALKDCVDLIEKLDKSIKDRKILDVLFPIKEKLHLAATEQLELERKIFNTERDLKNEIDRLNATYSKEVKDLNTMHSKEVSELNKEVSELHAENQKLKSELERKSKASCNVRVVRT